MNLFGSSPPSIFIGRFNYPKVRAGIASPPFSGNTEIYDLPENWRDFRLEDVLAMRYNLFLGFDSCERILDKIQEIVLCDRPVEVEIFFEKKPRGVIYDENSPPIGPSAPVKKIEIFSLPKPPEIVEKVFHDEMRAFDAVKILYEKGIPVSRIQKLLSAGILGKDKKFVPTRWAITAVDDILSKFLIETVRGFRVLDSYRVFKFKKSRNLFISVLLPLELSFEWFEAWFPFTVWNSKKDVLIEGDWEFKDKKNYAKVGGCYYAARLAALEYLKEIKRQAAVLMWREVYEGFRIPVGVWFVREMLRAMFKGKHEEFDDLKEALDFALANSRIGRKWLEKSRILKQKRLF